MSRVVRIGVVGLGLVASTALGGLLPSRAEAQVGWAVALRDVSDIKKFVIRLRDRVAEAPGADQAAAVVLYKQAWIKTTKSDYEYCYNFVLYVNDPSQIDEYVTDPYLGARGEIVEYGAFRMRKNKVRVLHGKDLSLDPPVHETQRAQAHFNFGELEAGDVVAWSAVVRVPAHLYVARVPAADRYPVLLASLRMNGTGDQIYAVDAEGDGEEKLKKEPELDMFGMPAAWKATLSSLEAVPDLPMNFPFGPNTPTFYLIHTETYVQVPNVAEGYSPSTGWGKVATMLANFHDFGMIETATPDSLVEALTQGMTTDAEKERAFFDFLRKELTVLRGDQYDRRGVRTIKEMVTERNATDWEMNFAFIRLCEAARIPVVLGAVRRGDYGTLEDSEVHSFQQFQELVVRCGGEDEEPRFYAPYAADAQPGTLPPSWGRSTVLSPSLDVVQAAAQYNMKVYNRMVVDANQSAQKVDTKAMEKEAEEEARKNGWFKIETVGGAD